MTTPLVIDFIELAKPNTAEFATFMHETNINVITAGYTKLGIPKAVIDEFSADVKLIANIVQHGRASEETKLIADADAVCDNLITYLGVSITNGMRSPDSAVAEKFRVLDLAMRPYRGMQRLSYREQIGLTRGLIIDFGGGRLFELMTAVGLVPILMQIEAANNRLAELIETRADEQVAGELPPAKEVRDRMIPAYRAMMVFAQSSANVAGATEPVKEFVTKQNKLIADTRASCNRRLALYRYWKKHREEQEAEAEAARLRGDEAAAALAREEADKALRAQRDAALLTAAEAEHTAHVAEELLEHHDEI